MHSIAELRDTSRAKMDAYTDPSGLFSFATYDASPTNHSDRLRPEDILAANLLSLRLSWREVIPLFAEGDGAPQRLRTLLDAAMVSARSIDRPFEAFKSLAALDAALVPLAAANAATADVAGWTAVTVSKVLHRHAPNIVPIVDSRVLGFYGLRRPGQAKDLRHRLWQDIQSNQGWLGDLAADYRTPDGRPLSVLRLVDILIWTPEPSTALG